MGDFAGELEYHLRFPVPRTKDDTEENDTDDWVSDYQEEKLPVVILFGWAGCKDKYLAKYSAIYEDKRCITLRCTPPVLMTFFRHDKLRHLGEELLDVLQAKRLDKHPIFFHVFSNGGAFFYQNVSSLLEKKKLDLKVKGIIFDSAPGQRRFMSIFKAFTTIIGGTPLFAVPVAFLITVMLFTAFFIFTASALGRRICVGSSVQFRKTSSVMSEKLEKFRLTKRRNDCCSVFLALKDSLRLLHHQKNYQSLLKGLVEFRKPQTDPINLVNEPFTWPQMFIYSKDDALVKFEDVEKFASIRSSKGVTVKNLCFGNSPHVQHLMTHRTAYVNAVTAFLNDCLRTSKSFQ